MALRELLVRPKSAGLLLALAKPGEHYISELARASGMTYAYAVHIISALEKEGVLKQEKKGRNKMITLTERGQVVATALDTLMREIVPPEAPKAEAKPEVKPEAKQETAPTPAPAPAPETTQSNNP